MAPNRTQSVVVLHVVGRRLRKYASTRRGQLGSGTVKRTDTRILSNYLDRGERDKCCYEATFPMKSPCVSGLRV
jgi:hypothetical protein